MGLKNKTKTNFVTFDPNNSIDISSGTECPSFDIDQDKTNPSCLFMVWPGGNINVYYYAEPIPGSTYDNSDHSPLRASDALAIDKKLDDGLPATGKMKDAGWAFGAPGTCTSSSAYNVSSTGYECSITFEIGFVTGSK